MLKRCLFPLALAALVPTITAAEQTAELTVDGTRMPALPTNAVVITAADIDAMPARDLIDVIDSMGGITVQRLYGTGSSQHTINSHGAAQPLLLINGRRMADQQQSTANLTSIPLQSVARIEVLPNRGGVMYGQGATNGVINIVTRQAEDTSGSARLGGGSYGTYQGGISAGAKKDNTRLFGALTGVHSDGYRQRNKLEQGAGYLDVRQQIDRSVLYVNLHAQHESLSLPGAIDVNASRRQHTLTNNKLKQRNYHVMPGAAWHFNSVTAYLEGGFFDKTIKHRSMGNSPHSVRTNIDGYSISPRLSGALNTGALSHQWDAGWDYYHTRYDNNLAGTQAADARQQQEGLYGQWATKLTPWLTTQAGARHERVKQRYAGAAPQPNTRHTLEMYEGSITAQLAEPLTFTVDAARTGAAPSLHANLQHATPLRAEHGAVYSGTLAWQHEGQRSAITYWEGVHKNSLHYDIAQDAHHQYSDDIRRKGFALNSRWQLDEHVWLTLNATLQKTQFKEGIWRHKQVPNSPRRTGYAQLDWQANDWLGLGFTQHFYSARFFGNDEANTQTRQRGFTWSNLTATAKVANSRITAGVYNLQNRKVYDTGFYDTNSQDHLVYPLPERHYRLDLSVDF